MTVGLLDLAAMLGVVTFSAAAALKVADWPATAVWLRELDLPTPERLAALGIASEAALIGGLTLAPRFALVAAAVWLIPATALLVYSHRRGASCGCFGSKVSSPATAIIRNVTLGVLFLIGAVAGSAQAVPSTSVALLAVGVVLLLAVARMKRLAA